MSDQFDPTKPQYIPPTKGEVAKTAFGKGAGSIAVTGAGSTASLGAVIIAKRLGVQMSVEEAVVIMGIVTTVITPMLRIAESLGRQFLAHRGYVVP